MLEVSGFQEKANNIRTRYIFEKDNIKFEIDEYEVPRMNVIAVEGDKDKVDIIYNDLKKTRGRFIVKKLNKVYWLCESKAFYFCLRNMGKAYYREDKSLSKERRKKNGTED